MGRYLHFHISGKAERLSMCLMVIFPKIIYFILYPFLLDPSFSYSFVGVLYSDYVTNIFSKSIPCLLTLWHTEVLNYDMVKFINLFLYVFCFFGSVWECLPYTKNITPYFILTFAVLCFIFKSLFYLEFVFINNVKDPYLTFPNRQLIFPMAYTE